MTKNLSKSVFAARLEMDHESVNSRSESAYEIEFRDHRQKMIKKIFVGFALWKDRRGPKRAFNRRRRAARR